MKQRVRCGECFYGFHEPSTHAAIGGPRVDQKSYEAQLGAYVRSQGLDVDDIRREDYEI